LNINRDLVAAMGFSSGSYNSHYLHLVMSKTIKGSGLFAGSIYGTSYGEKIVEDGKTEEQLNQEKAKMVGTAK